MESRQKNGIQLKNSASIKITPSKKPEMWAET